jgi:hypothetical protein
MDWPDRGVYFFFDSHTAGRKEKDRVVRVGTHALKAGSQTTLWNRLSQHRGTNKSGGGNHRTSIFRLLVGNALIHGGEHSPVISWGLKQDMSKAAVALGTERHLIKEEEHSLELAVSRYIGNLPFLWLDIEDEPGPDSERGRIERNSIALISEFNSVTGSRRDSWLGGYSDRDKVRGSQLWNNIMLSTNMTPFIWICLNNLLKTFSRTRSERFLVLNRAG